MSWFIFFPEKTSFRTAFPANILANNPCHPSIFCRADFLPWPSFFQGLENADVRAVQVEVWHLGTLIRWMTWWEHHHFLGSFWRWRVICCNKSAVVWCSLFFTLCKSLWDPPRFGWNERVYLQDEGYIWYMKFWMIHNIHIYIYVQSMSMTCSWDDDGCCSYFWRWKKLLRIPWENHSLHWERVLRVGKVAQPWSA